MKLIYTATGQLVEVGDKTHTFDGCPFEVESIEEPRSPASTGRVYGLLGEAKTTASFYPSVIGAKWVDRADRDYD